MSEQVSCPFCSYEVAPARAPTGALVCPMCRNTGDTKGMDAEELQDEFRAFEARVIAHVSRLQQLLEEAVHDQRTDQVEARFTRLEDELRNQTARGEAAATATAVRLLEAPRADDVDERVTQLADRLDEVSARVDTAAIATAIRLESQGTTRSMDDLVGAVEALRHDIQELHEEYDRASIPALRHEVKMLTTRVRSLEHPGAQGPYWDDDATAEWERPEPDTVDEAEAVTPRWSTSAVRTEDEPAHEQAFEEPLAATASAHDPLAAGPEPDFSGVPPVMDKGGAMRDLVARDAMAMSGAARQAHSYDSAPLDGIEAALHDIDARLQTLRNR